MRSLAFVVLCSVVATGCAGVTASAPTATPPTATPPQAATGAPVTVTSPSAAASSAIADPCGVDEIPAGSTCLASFIDADAPSAPFARYTIPTSGWRPFNGTYKDAQAGGTTQRVALVFVIIANLTVDACEQQQPREPPIGDGVDDLAAGLAALPPFEVIVPPTEVTAFGYPGKHVEIRVPLDQPSGGFEMFTGCGHHLLKTWIAPGHVSSAFNGYTGPGDTEEFWVLDVDGRRLVIAALTSAAASAELVAERQAILDSVVILP